MKVTTTKAPKGRKPRENLRGWFDAGVTCVGMGSQLIRKEFIGEKDCQGLQAHVKVTLERIAKIRERK